MAIEYTRFCPEEGVQYPLFGDEVTIDDSVILPGSMAVRGVRFGDLPIELFGFEASDIAPSTKANGLEVYPLDGRNEPTWVDIEGRFDEDNPDHVTGLIHAVMSARSHERTGSPILPLVSLKMVNY